MFLLRQFMFFFLFVKMLGPPCTPCRACTNHMFFPLKRDASLRVSQATTYGIVILTWFWRMLPNTSARKKKKKKKNLELSSFMSLKRQTGQVLYHVSTIVCLGSTHQINPRTFFLY